MKTDSQVDRIQFNEKIINLVTDYIKNMDVYPEDSCIAIKNRIFEIELLTPHEANSTWKLYPVTNFLLKNEDNDDFETDIDIVWELSGKYFFVR